ncbi:hypothetical protein MMC07_005409 [Pseudocyphellaria aurata]|nr:hypothetical protein [Pseudocyphellaria aurata]
MSLSPSGMLDSLEIETQDLAPDSEPQQSGLEASNGTSSMVVDVNYKDTRDSQSPLFVSDGSPVKSPVKPTPINYDTLSPVVRDGIQVIVPSIQRRWEYLPYEEPVGGEATEESDYFESLQAASIHSSGVKKEKLLASRRTKKPDGVDATKTSKDRSSLVSSGSKSSEPITRRSTRKALSRDSRATGIVDFSNLQLSSDDELTTARTMKASIPRNRRLLSARGIKSNRQSSDADLSVSNPSVSESRSENTGSEDDSANRRHDREMSSRATRKGRSNGKRRVNYAERSVVDDSDSDETDGSQALGKRKRGQPKRSGGRKIRKSIHSSYHPQREPVEGTRRSGRTGRALGNMREIFEDDIPDVSSAKADTKFSGAKENYRPLLKDNDFRLRHCQTCDTCNEDGENEEKGQLIYCQGCTTSYHQKCLGPRSNRDHLVTKIGADDFVLQCRRCVGVARKKDPMAPSQDECSKCHIKGESSNGFREKKSSKQEQKDREDNDGEDPIERVSDRLINNFENVLFRCVKCYRAWHMDCLPARTNKPSFAHSNEESIATQRFGEYSLDWSCQDCVDAPADIDCLVAWRPIDQVNYEPGTSTELIPEDNKEYLVKYKKLSYFKTAWKPGAWVWGITASAMRKAFARRDNGNNLPKMKTEDAIPEEYLRVDIVLDVEYTNIVKVHVEKVDLARIKEVKRALVKFKGLGYEDVVWEEPPDVVDSHRWDDFKSAYDYWVLGRYVHLPSPQSLSSHLKNVRSQSFKDKIEIDKQPEYLTGGELYPYQMEGMNWLYYQWHRQQNAILADEMGLGKTIQIIGFLATLQQKHKCWPFLVVVPNSTCPNWRREIKRWAPSVRVVAYYGSSEARKLAEKYELFPGGGKDLRCHVVITSYEAAQQDEFKKVFRGVTWQGLIVDEGQRLKNDKNILYEALDNLLAPFKVLLTGTPLQNNPRELFNLLQFLDKTNDAQALEKEYAILTEEKVSTLHKKLKMLMLRRTKAGALEKELPPMAQIIVPVTMSVVQKKLYKSIIAKNSDLIKSIFGASQRSLKQTDRANLNNILMQLRKCLCHPFVYSNAIEERSSNAAISHRNLVEASSKLKLLEIMLPKLQALGHRVLIFSQFLAMLDMVEDFLDGLSLLYRRLDGSMNALQKQKRIDEFNAPTSSVFAFLLSTRAGGVGINLATADTVIILDPDFNPHQDIQALSRAHRIGQMKPVLVFQLTTRDSAEEKIMQVGKRKMALDHALIEQMGAAQDDAGMDLESILRHGAEAVFKDDDTHDIHYDSASVDKLLDRSQIETVQASKGDSVESKFSFARVWANDKSSLEDTLNDTSETDANIDSSIWEKILETREQEVAAETVAKSEAFGRGRRKRQTVDYARHVSHGAPDSPGKDLVSPYVDRSDSDPEFQARAVESDGDDSAEDNVEDVAGDLDVEVTTRGPEPTHQPSWVPHKPLQPPVNTESLFKRAEVPRPLSYAVLPSGKSGNESNQTARNGTCLVCSVAHPLGHCPLKQAGAEKCGLCGIAHYASGHIRNCPHLNSVTQCRAMLETLKSSTESQADVEHAKKYLVGVIGGLKRKRKSRDQAHQPPMNVRASNGQASSHYVSDADVEMDSFYRRDSRPGKENMAVEPRTFDTASYPHARGRK